MKTLSCAARASLIILSVLCATRLYGHQKLPASDGTPEIDALIKQQNWAAAKVQLDQWILRHPHDAQARFKQATALARLGRNDEAIAAFETLIAHYPELPEPYNNLAALHVEQGRLDDARATLEMAINANPGYALAYQNLGALYLQLAARAYRRAAEIDPHDALTVQRQQQIQSIIAQPAATHGDAKSTIDSALALP